MPRGAEKIEGHTGQRRDDWASEEGEKTGEKRSRLQRIEERSTQEKSKQKSAGAN